MTDLQKVWLSAIIKKQKKDIEVNAKMKEMRDRVFRGGNQRGRR